MKKETFKTLVALCNSEQQRIDGLFVNDPNYLKYKIAVTVMSDEVFVYPAAHDCLYFASKFFQIAELLDVNISIRTFLRDSDYVPCLQIF